MVSLTPHLSLSECRSFIRLLQASLPLLAQRQLWFISTCVVSSISSDKQRWPQPSPHVGPILGLEGLFISLLDPLMVAVRVVMK